MSRVKLGIIIASILLTVSYVYSQKGGMPANVKKEKVIISGYPKVTNDPDSLKILIYMQIPYTSMQYVKIDSKFVARYEATIALQSNKGTQLFREVWQDSIVLYDYQHTRSNLLSRTLMVTYPLDEGKYKIVGDLLDLDTKKHYKNSVKIDVSDFDDQIFINKPILLEKFDGDWGFGNNLIPAIKNSAFNVDDGLLFYLSGKVSPGKYKLKNTFSNKSNELFYESTIIDSSINGLFEHIIKLPKDTIQGINFKIESELIQSKYSTNKSTEVMLKRVGISHMIQNIEEALKQMNYILEPREKRRIRKTPNSKKEKLFKELWDKRDPTPGTVKNELMDTYYSRVEFANSQFESHIEGWKTDMGMIYILFGPPDDIQKYVDQYQGIYETWHYYRISKSYTFVGDMFGNYSLLNPYFDY